MFMRRTSLIVRGNIKRNSIIWGESDKVIAPVYADAFKRMLTGAVSVKLQKISAGGHALFVEQPKASAAAIIDCCAS